MGLQSEIPSIDIRASIDGVKRRWWILGTGIIASLGVVGLQDLGVFSRTEPKLTVVERKYEPLNEIDELGLARIEPSMIVPTPSFDNQFAILTSPEVLEQLRLKSGSDATMEITRTEPRFTIVDSIDNANNRVSFLSTGTPSITFKCFGSTRDVCLSLTDAYVARAIELRRESMLGGLRDASALIEDLIENARADRANSPSDSYESAALETELSTLKTKRIALERAISTISGAFVVITDDTYQVGGGRRAASASTYGFAATVGLILGLLVALQLSYLEKSIRYSWQVQRMGQGIRVIGSPNPRTDVVQATAVASALERAAITGSTSIFIVALSKKSRLFATEILALATSVSGEIVESIDSVSVDQLINRGDKALLIVIEQGQSNRAELSETIGIAQAGGLSLIGVVLIS